MTAVEIEAEHTLDWEETREEVKNYHRPSREDGWKHTPDAEIVPWWVVPLIIVAILVLAILVVHAQQFNSLLN